jgi:hypothetical protein
LDSLCSLSDASPNSDKDQVTKLEEDFAGNGRNFQFQNSAFDKEFQASSCSEVD